MKLQMILVMAVVAAGAALMACSSDDKKTTSSGGYTDHSSPYPACNAIIQWCHPYDIGEGEVHDCHDQGHEARSDADCAPVKQHCYEVCSAAAVDAGSGLDGGAL